MADNTIELVIRTVDQASAQIAGIGKKVDELAGGTEKLRALAAGTFAFFGIERLVESITEAQTATNDLNRLFGQFGRSVGVTKENMLDFADATSKATTVANDALISGQAELLKFTSLTGAQFERTRQVMVDLAASMGGNAKAAAQQLGRALENPIQGIRILREQGVVLSAGQRELIENFVETGRSAQAQTFILDQLSQRTKGLADASANTLGGALTQLRNNFAEAFEGKGADLGGLTENIKSISREISKPEFQHSLETLVTGMVTFATFTTKAALGWADIAERVGIAAAKFVNGPDSQIEILNDRKAVLEDRLADTNRLPGEKLSDYNERVAVLQKQIGALNLQIADIINAGSPSITDAIIKSLDSAYAAAGKRRIDVPKSLRGELLKDIIPSTSKLTTDDPFGLFASGKAPTSVMRKYFEDTQSDTDRAVSDYFAKTAELIELKAAGMVNDLDFNQKNSDLLDKLLPEVKASQLAQKITVPISEGVQLLQDGFTQLFDNLDFRAKSFGQVFLDVIKRLVAEDFSRSLINSLTGFFNSNKGGSGGGGGNSFISGVIGAVGHLFGFAGGGEIHGPSIVGEDGPELVWPGGGSSARVMNQRQLAFAGGGDGGGVNFVTNHHVTIVADNSAKTQEALLKYYATQSAKDKAEFERKLRRNGYSLR